MIHPAILNARRQALINARKREQFMYKCELPEHLILDNYINSREDDYHKAVADYVMGKRDTMPTQKEFQIKVKPRNLMELKDEKKQVTLSKLFAKKPDAKDAQSRDALHGTGITKRIAERSEKEHQKTQQQIIEPPLLIKPKDSPLENIIREQESEIIKQDPLDSIILDEYQTAALNGLLHEKYACLIGAAGTGKTTVTRKLVKLLESNVPVIQLNKTRRETDQFEYRSDEDKKKDQNVAICFCSFTGRAVQQMKRVLPNIYHPLCNTIHATLGYHPVSEDRIDPKTGETKSIKVFRPAFTATNKLPYKICIVDESGMCPIPLWDELFAALPDDCRIILIGDINQLPPVQGRSVLGFAMTKWPTFTLEKIHRQAADNPIIANAHKILKGHFPEKDKTKFAIIDNMDGGSTKTLHQLLATVKKLHQINKFDPFEDGLIVPQNKGTIGQVHINEYLVTYFNPERTENGVVVNKRTIVTAGYIHVPFAIGDKVMLLENDRRRGLTNGMIGEVVNLTPNGLFRGEKSAHAAISMEKFTEAIDVGDLTKELEKEPDDINVKEEEEDESQRPASHIMTVKFFGANLGQEVDFSTAGQFKKVTHAYAFTCHKSQGGEYPTVVILCHSANIRMLTREWLYTAVTRAQERVILLCNSRGLKQALGRQTIKGKTVKEKAAQFLALQDKTDTRIPMLPDPEDL